MTIDIGIWMGGSTPFAMSLRADLVAWWDLKGLFFWQGESDQVTQLISNVEIDGPA
jgi:hypothetical protein